MGVLKTGELRYRGLVGTGGIGSGSYFLLGGNATLGREENRGGRFLERQDYCKLHTVGQYLKTLLGQGFEVIPIGKVGADEAGERLLREMEETGLSLRHVRRLPGARTLFSLCFLYPDGSGGSLTAEDSASAALGVEDILRGEEDFAALGKKGIALAAPEVPLPARGKLLELGGRHGLFRAAGFTNREMAEIRDSGLLEQVDLLALNLEEAKAAAGIAAELKAAEEAAEEAVSRLAASYPRLNLLITAGARGSWSWDGTVLRRDPALPVETAGASTSGGAHLSGVLAGLAAGLSLWEAQQLGSLTAAASLTGPPTIHKSLSREMLRSLAYKRKDVSFSVMRLLEAG